MWCVLSLLCDVVCVYSDEEEFHSIEINKSGGGFGFSIRGGAEYNSPLCVLRIADGGAAEKDGRLRVREGGKEGGREGGRGCAALALGVLENYGKTFSL